MMHISGPRIRLKHSRPESALKGGLRVNGINIKTVTPSRPRVELTGPRTPLFRLEPLWARSLTVMRLGLVREVLLFHKYNESRKQLDLAAF
jgi:hypothetical protein